MAIERINQRTLDGESVNGSSFKPYSKEYAEKKGVDPGSVDLFLDGDMLDSLDYELEDGKVKIFINNDEVLPRAYNHHVGDTLPKRPWFGITTDEVASLLEELPELEAEESRFTLADLEAAVKLIDFES